MTSMVRHYSLSNPPPLEGALDGRETAHEAEILEVQALQAERDGECGRDILLMERALQIRCHLVNRLREKWANAASGTGSPSAAGAHRVSVLANADAVGKEELLLEYQAQCGELYDAAERLVVRCNGLGVEHFKRGAFSEASPLLEYAMQLTEDGAYPLCEVDERRRHLRGVTLNNLGCMERRRGHFSEALQYMKSSMEMTGVESPVAYMNTSAILIQLRLSDEAVRMAERSIELLYQTPEDPSLLAVAHHNLAMALEPVDPARCLEEYALAYRTACSTLGPESETSLSILRSWRRYEATRVPPAMGAFFTAGDGAAASRLRGLAGAAPTRHAYTAPHRLPATMPRTHNGKSGAGPPMDLIELFPHPFLPSASISSAPTKTPRDVTPIYRPAVVPRRPLAPRPPPGVTATSSSRSREPQSQPRHQQQEQHRQPRRQYGTEKVMRSSPPASRTAVAAPRPPPANRASELAVAAGSGRVAASMTPSPPPSRQRQTTAHRRYSPTTPAQESSRKSPPRTDTRQQRLPMQKRTADACLTASGPRKREKSTSHYASDRLTTQASSTALLSSPAQSPGRGPRRPIKESGSSNHSLPMPLPRNLPPLQTAVAAEPPSVAPNPSYSRSLHDAKTNASLPPTSASLSLTSDPLTFLQNRLEILLQDEEELEHKYAQATVIQRYYRGHLAHRRVAALRATRASYARLAQLRRHMAARCIQRAFRRHRRHSRYPLAADQLGRYAAAGGRRGAQHQAATQLQRIARGWLARRHYAQLRKYTCESPAAATRIQRWIRALQARRHYAALLTAKAQQEAMALEHERRQYAATRIQGQWLTHLQRRACQAALRNRMMARAAEDARCRMRAAIIIQSAWRGYQARRLYQDTYLRTSQLRTARLEYERRRQAAVRLQAFGRMLIARQHATPLLTVARFRAAAEIRTRSHEGQAAIKIQCAYRRHVARRVCATKRAARKKQISQDLVQVRTATVQRAGRGYMARKDVGRKMSAVQAEAERYERRLLALKQKELGAARAVALASQLNISALRECEGEQRRMLARAEQQQWHDMLTQCNALLASTKETEVKQEAMKAISSVALHGFSRIIKAKKQRAHRQEARDAYLDQCAAEDAEAHKEASARVITDFMRSAAARSTLRSLVKTVSSYNDARAMQEEDDKKPAAATTDEAAPKRPLTAEQIAAERAELDRLERELLASEATAAPKRPLTAEQIAAERAELDRLERELLASEATAAPKRPLTAEQIAAERAELDRLERELLASEATAAPKRPLTAEQIAAERAELDRLERELLASEATAAPKRPLTAEQIAAERAELDRLERELLASEATAAPKRPLTAEQIAAERAELDRLERELLASEATAAPKRPLTAEQIAAERAELDRLERELLASEATAAPKRPLTAEQIAAERAELDRLEREELLGERDTTSAYEEERPPAADESFTSADASVSASALADVMLARLKAIWQAELAAEKQRRQQREDLHRAIFEHRQQRMAAAEEGEELSPYRINRVHLQMPSSAAPKKALPSPAELPTTMGNKYRQERAAQERAAVHCIERYFIGWGARKHLKALLRVLDEYLSALQDFDRHEGPVLTFVRLREVLARYPDLQTRVSQLPVSLSPPECAAIEDVNSSASPAISITSRKTLKGFSRIIKAKKQRAHRQEARDAYLDQCAAEDAEAHKEASARVITDFMRSAAARSTLRSLVKTVSSYNDARAMQEEDDKKPAAATTDEAAPKRPLTAEQIAAERAELDRLERELLASEATAAPKRPLTAEQIAAERAELDRLERELLASEATAAPKRPLTAEQIAAERAELDRLERGERDVDAGERKASPLLASEQLLAEGAVIGHLERWEQIGFDDGARHPPRRLTEQQFVVERLALDQLDHVKQVATERGRPDRPSCVEQKMLSAAALYAQRVQEERCSADSAHTSTPSSVRTFEPRQLEGLTSSEAGGRLWVFAKAIRDKKDLRQRQAARDAYLQETHNENAIGTDEEEKQQEERAPTPSSGASTWRRCSNEANGDDREMVNQEALCQLYHQERRSFASSLVGGFVDIIKAKKQRAHRQEARDAYLDQCAAEDAEAHKEASARVITDFMRSAAARSTLRSLSKTMSSYNDARAMQEEDDKKPAAPTTDDGSGEGAYATSAELCEHSPWSAALRIQRFFRGVQARRRVRVLQEAYRAYLEEELAVEELLYSAAVTIQCLYRGHLARRQAAMVIVQRDLYLLSLQEEDGSGADSKRKEGSDAPLPAVLSFLASSPKIVAGGGAEAAATRSFTPRRSSSSSYTGLREVASTAIVTEVNEADEAALDQLLHRP
ncbi:Flagellar Member 7 [Leishmania donovani]|uniref:Flagellar Member 7 n=1 Tax=Leishmania donovani TaxID=5661 RepID=A0A3Q8IDD9_LEIDO|nr:Flagellar Member 7 [Leishmania donovani]